MMELFEKHELITIKHMKSINRVKHQLKTDIVKTVLEPNHCDVHIVQSDMDTRTELDSTVEAVAVKHEERRDPVLVDADHTQHMTVTSEEFSDADGFNGHLDACKEEYLSDDSDLSETEQMTDTLWTTPSTCKEEVVEAVAPIKQEITFACTTCLMEFADEDMYIHHTMTHLENGAGDGECDTSQVCKPHTAVSSSHSSLITENKEAIQKLIEDLQPATDLAETSVAHLPTSFATNNAVEVFPPEDVNTTVSYQHKRLPDSNPIKSNPSACMRPLLDIGLSTSAPPNTVLRLPHPPAPRHLQVVGPAGWRSLPDCYVKLYDIFSEKVTARHDPLQMKTRTAVRPFDNQNIASNDSSYQPAMIKPYTHCSLWIKQEVDVNNQSVDSKLLVNCVVKLYDIFKRQDESLIKTRKAVRFCDGQNILSKNSSYQAARQRRVRSTGCIRPSNNRRKEMASFTCDICRKVCKRKSILVKHKKTHAEVKPLTCEICQYKCKYQSCLTKHMRTHTVEKPYLCKICDYKCETNCKLLKHLRTYHGEKCFVCDICQFKAKFKCNLIHHMRTHTGERPYVCKICSKKFSRSDHLVNHVATHTGARPYSCSLCKYATADKYYLRCHMKIHTGERPYSCDLCKFKCREKYQLAPHMRIHTNEKRISCELCQFTTHFKESLVRHMRIHSGVRPHSCSICGFKFAAKSHLNRHIKTHSDERPHSCNLCKYKCKDKQYLVIHMRTHSGEKPYTCECCGNRFATTCSLLAHKRLHTGEKPYYCDICNSKFARKGDLDAHIKTHTGEKPFACKLCEYKCIKNGDLVRHMRKHTGEKPQSCEICHKKFARLKPHMRTHTGEQPYSCKICNKKFTLKGNLDCHIKIHTGEKPYCCKLCDYKCISNSDLKKHIRTHTGEKPYSCMFCDYKCATNSYLVKHIRTHTRE
ncbi:zinc finger protein 271-like isoform X1 [Maniola jurtina]|uniref:zinc finger protein 271-like isoform X1 n=1 Tax=Maniola jurtina TaxID=191418 RepID=UPI001E68F759|nr:zinc finger protein 271-like isoform X1 [Maniola jurtina]